jgi:tyrosyl-tRNA synthetase
MLRSDNLSIDEKLSLISRSTAETIGLDELREKLERKKQLHGYWGTAPTRSPSIGYLIPMLKFRDMINAGVNMRVLIADLHAFLDKGSKWIDRTPERVAYYKFLIAVILRRLNITESDYEFVLGSDFQLDRTYVRDLFKLLTHVTVPQAKKAGSEVVKQNKEPSLGSLVYPLMQVIDETAQQTDVELGGLDQRKIFMLSRDSIEHIGYKKCAYVMNEMLPSLSKSKPGTKMSSSESSGKIEFLDEFDTIFEKLKKAYCVEKEVKDNPCMELARLIIYPIGSKVGDYETYELLETAWMAGEIYGLQLKQWLAKSIDWIIAPIRREIKNNMNLYDAAFSEVSMVPDLPKLKSKVSLRADAPVFKPRAVYTSDTDKSNPKPMSDTELPVTHERVGHFTIDAEFDNDGNEIN